MEYIINLHAAWIGIAAGLSSGIVMGLFFRRENWLGGYGSWPRRMLRLGHISCFGIAFLNLAYALTVYLLPESAANAYASQLLIAGAITMPLVCLASAFHKVLSNLFFIPVLCLTGGTLLLLVNGGLL